MKKIILLVGIFMLFSITCFANSNIKAFLKDNTGFSSAVDKELFNMVQEKLKNDIFTGSYKKHDDIPIKGKSRLIHKELIFKAYNLSTIYINEWMDKGSKTFFQNKEERWIVPILDDKQPSGYYTFYKNSNGKLMAQDVFALDTHIEWLDYLCNFDSLISMLESNNITNVNDIKVVNGYLINQPCFIYMDTNKGEYVILYDDNKKIEGELVSLTDFFNTYQTIENQKLSKTIPNDTAGGGGLDFIKTNYFVILIGLISILSLISLLIIIFFVFKMKKNKT